MYLLRTQSFSVVLPAFALYPFKLPTIFNDCTTFGTDDNERN